MILWHGSIVQHGGMSSHIQYSITKTTEEKVKNALQDWLKKDLQLKKNWPKADPIHWGKGSYGVGFGCGPYDISIHRTEID